MEDLWKHLPNDVFIKHIAPMCSIDVRLYLRIPPTKIKESSIHRMLSYMLSERANARREYDVVHRFSTRLYQRGLIGNLRYESIGYHVCIYYANVLKYSIEKWYEIEINNQTFASISRFDVYDSSGNMLFAKNNNLEALPTFASTRDFYRFFMSNLRQQG